MADQIAVGVEAGAGFDRVDDVTPFGNRRLPLRDHEIANQPEALLLRREWHVPGDAQPLPARPQIAQGRGPHFHQHENVAAVAVDRLVVHVVLERQHDHVPASNLAPDLLEHERHAQVRVHAHVDHVKSELALDLRAVEPVGEVGSPMKIRPPRRRRGEPRVLVERGQREVVAVGHHDEHRQQQRHDGEAQSESLEDKAQRSHRSELKIDELLRIVIERPEQDDARDQCVVGAPPDDRRSSRQQLRDRPVAPDCVHEEDRCDAADREQVSGV